MNWRYYKCLNCKSILKTSVDNPDNNIKCVICGHSKFNEVSKETYEAIGGHIENGD